MKGLPATEQAECFRAVSWWAGSLKACLFFVLVYYWRDFAARGAESLYTQK